MNRFRYILRLTAALLCALLLFGAAAAAECTHENAVSYGSYTTGHTSWLPDKDGETCSRAYYLVTSYSCYDWY